VLLLLLLLRALLLLLLLEKEVAQAPSGVQIQPSLPAVLQQQ
jgi:hypothetical protein